MGVTPEREAPLDRLVCRLSREPDEQGKVGLAAGPGAPRSVPLAALDTENHEVTMKRAIRAHGFDAVIAGIRWDENPARSTEVFFSPHEDPDHVRVHPILPWTEREVWTYTLEHELPVHPFYERGYRSFDGIHDSEPTDTRPAWEQDLETTEERAARVQNKEEIMEWLRALGYI